MSWFTENIRDPIESIAPTAIGSMWGPAGAALAGQLALPFEAESARKSGLQQSINTLDLGLGLYGTYQGLTGGNPWSWGTGPAATSSASPAVTPGASSPSGIPGAPVSSIPTDVPSAAAAPVGIPTAPASPVSAAAPSSTSAAPGFMDNLTKYGPLAMYGLGTMGQLTQGSRTANAMRNISAPQRQQGQALLSQYQQGKINPGDEYAIAQWKQNALAQSRQYYAQAGLSDSSQAKEAENQINAQAVNMHQQALQSILQQGLSTLNVTDAYQAQAIQLEMQNSQQALANSLNFFNTYGQWLRQTPTITGQAPTPQAQAPQAPTPETTAPTA